MLLKNRLFERQAPSKKAKSIYIFCEGKKREYQYFSYFRELDSRVNVEPYKLNASENNSPKGLLEIAKVYIFATEDNPAPKYNFQQNDEVWIVVDVDKDKHESRKPQVAEIKEFCKNNQSWFIVQSNPCFEVWLFYHFFQTPQNFVNDDVCSGWKTYLNELQPGGFDSRRHSLLIQNAVRNSKPNFNFDDKEPAKGKTEVYLLAESMLVFLRDKIQAALRKTNKN